MDVMANRLMVGIPLPAFRVPPLLGEMAARRVILRRGCRRAGVRIRCVPPLDRRVMRGLAMGMCPVVGRGILLVVVGLLRRLAHGFGVVAGRFLRKGVALQQQLHFGQRMLRVFGVARGTLVWTAVVASSDASGASAASEADRTDSARSG